MLTGKQLLVLDFIKRFIAKNGYSPTVREICSGLNLSSPATVHQHLKNLVKKGIITVSGSKSRTLELLVDNEYVHKNQNTALLKVLDNNVEENFTRTFLEVPIFMLNGYDKDDLLIYKENTKKIYIINIKGKVIDNTPSLYKINNLLKISDKQEGEFIGTLVSEFKIY